VPVSVDDDAPEAQHKNTNEGLRAPREREYHGEASEDFDDRPSDEEDEDPNTSQSLGSRLASALAAGRKSLEDGREWFGRSSGEWIERGSRSAPKSSSGGKPPANSRASPSSGPSRSSQPPPRPLAVRHETNETTNERNETRRNAELKRDNALAPAERTRISAGRTPARSGSKARGGGGGGDEGAGEDKGSSSELPRGTQV
jgi:hypothetical protein